MKGGNVVEHREKEAESSPKRPIESPMTIRSHMLFAEYVVAEIDAALMDSSPGLRTRISGVRDLMEAQRQALADLLRAMTGDAARLM
jgi:hypothetical protein